MKKHLLFIIITIVHSTLVLASGLDAVMRGPWGGAESPRSFIPAPPRVTIEGDFITIRLADALSDLDVVVYDVNGGIVYQDCISTPVGNYTKDIYLNPGGYKIVFTHDLGYRWGEFEIE